MTIQEIHNQIKVLKNQAKGQGTYHSPEEIDLCIHAGQLDKYNEEKRKYLESKMITYNLRPFVDKATISLTLGIGDVTSDIDLLLFGTDSAEVGIEVVEAGEWPARIKSDIEHPSLEYPIVRLSGSNVEVRPSSISKTILHFLKAPTKPVWGYTYNGNRMVYNAASSTQLEWHKSAHNDIILRACSYLGIPTDNQSLTQLKSFKKQTENV
jgi:hypothetical protein